MAFIAVTNKRARIDYPATGNYDMVESGTEVTVRREKGDWGEISKVANKPVSGIMARADYDPTP